MNNDQIFKELLPSIFLKYNFTNSDKEKFLSLTKPIFSHEEFKKRLDNKEFSHHDDVSLGEHILNAAALSYKLGTDNLINPRLVVLVAMFHDLYEYPWQNSTIQKNDFFNVHGFSHPIEAAINAVTWFPEYFADEKEAKIVIDGIIHHMWPFPVRALDGTEIELNNQSKFDELPDNIKKLITKSTLRHRLGKVSFSKSLYKEGRLVSKADKLVSFKNDLSFKGALLCVKGNKRKFKVQSKNI